MQLFNNNRSRNSSSSSERDESKSEHAHIRSIGSERRQGEEPQCFNGAGQNREPIGPSR